MDWFYKVLGYVLYHWKISLLILIALIAIPPIIVSITTKKKIKGLADNSLEMTPSEFFRMRNASLGGRGRKHISSANDYVGVYILYNESKNMYYVGQAKKVLQRINAHLTGHGNGDVYADFKYGDSFKIRTIAFAGSGYTSIDQLEKDTIASYKAYSKGYNRTRGNSK